MSDSDGRGGRGHDVAVTRGLVSIAQWQQGQVILCDGLAVYQASAGSPVRDLSCIICRRPVQGSLFLLHFVATSDLAECGNPHLVSIAAARHVACQRGDDDYLTAMIIASVPCMTD